MNSLVKIIMGLSLIPSSTLLAAPSGQNEIGFDAYLQQYHPLLYRNLDDNNVDLTAVEFNAENTVNQEDISKSTRLVRSTPRQERKTCERYGGVFLENNYIATCVSKDGTFGNGNHSLGMTFNPAGSGTATSSDYLKPGNPHEYFSVSFGNQIFTNNNSNGPLLNGSDNIPTQIKRLDRYTAQEGGVLVNSVIKGSQHGQKLSIIQKYTLDPNSREIIVRVEMRNDGWRVLDNLQYARGLDPDQDRPSTFNTLNRKGHSFFPSSSGKVIDVSPNNIAWAEGKKSLLSVALYSVDPVKHNTCISQYWTVVPSDILSQNCGSSPQPVYDRPNNIFGFNYSDSTINIAFSVGNLYPGRTKIFSYKYLFDKSMLKKDPVDIGSELGSL